MFVDGDKDANVQIEAFNLANKVIAYLQLAF
jgi:hypothetical protein